jgi:serine/threonine protein phosphatase PrpC
MRRCSSAPVNCARPSRPLRHRHILTNALVGSGEDVQVDTDRLQLDEAITSILMETTRSSDACQRLVQRALDGRRRDNVTVIMAAYRLPEGPPGTK